MFYLAIADRRQSIDGFTFFAGRLLLGDSLELLRCASGHWTAQQYRRQWQAALARLVSHPMVTSAFVTTVARGPDNFEWWTARRRGHVVTFRNQWVSLRRPRPHVAVEFAHEHKQRPSFRRLPHQRRSEWRVPMSAIRRYMRQVKGPAA